MHGFESIRSRCDWTAVAVLALILAIASYPSFEHLATALR